MILRIVLMLGMLTSGAYPCDTLEVQGDATKIATTIQLPHEILYSIFEHLADGSLSSARNIAYAGQACKDWYDVSQYQQLLKLLRLSIHGDYPEDEATLKNAAIHLLRVKVNVNDNPIEIVDLIIRHRLWFNLPYKDFIGLLSIDRTRFYINSFWKLYYSSMETWSECIFGTNQTPINEKIKNRFLDNVFILADKTPKYSQSLFDYNEKLISQNDTAALKRKIKGLSQGIYGYTKDTEAAENLVEQLITYGRPKAVNPQSSDLVFNNRNTASERELIERGVEQNDSKAIEKNLTD